MLSVLIFDFEAAFPYILAQDEQMQELQRELQESKKAIKSLQAYVERKYYVSPACHITC